MIHIDPSNARSLFGAAIIIALVQSPVAAQTTFRACRVPDVGVIYMIGMSGGPNACLDASHVEFQWTEGGTIADGSITTALLADGAVTQAKLDAGVTLPLATSSVGTAQLADDAVTASKIADGAIATAELDLEAVTSAKIADGTIGASDLALQAVTSAAIFPAAITANHIAAGAVTTIGLVDLGISTADLADGVVTTDKLSDGGVTTAKLAVPPRAAFSMGGGAVALTGTRQNIGGVPITVGGPGVVVVTATGMAEISGTSCSYIFYGISLNSGGAPQSQENFLNRPDFGATGVQTWANASMNSIYAYPVNSAGTYNFYFVARRSDSGGTCNAYSKGVSAIFIPS
jgi:hypothetical protein